MARAIRNVDELTFILIGSRGSGKSSTGNTILGKQIFTTGVGTVPITTEVQFESLSRFGHKLVVFDTPGLEHISDISKIYPDTDLLSGQNVVYLITIKIGRHTDAERLILNEILKKYQDISKNAIIIFTNKNEENEHDSKEEKWLKKNPSLLNLIGKYKLKYVAFENKHLSEEKKDDQVKDLFDIAKRMDKDENILRKAWNALKDCATM